MEETSSQSLKERIDQGLERALAGFLVPPNDAETRNAIYTALSTMIQDEARRVVSENLKVEHDGKSVTISMNGPLGQLLQILFGRKTSFADWSYTTELPGWKKPEEAEMLRMTRPYIDPRTHRPTRGRPFLTNLEDVERPEHRPSSRKPTM